MNFPADTTRRRMLRWPGAPLKIEAGHLLYAYIFLSTGLLLAIAGGVADQPSALSRAGHAQQSVRHAIESAQYLRAAQLDYSRTDSVPAPAVSATRGPAGADTICTPIPKLSNVSDRPGSATLLDPTPRTEGSLRRRESDGPKGRDGIGTAPDERGSAKPFWSDFLDGSWNLAGIPKSTWAYFATKAPSYRTLSLAELALFLVTTFCLGFLSIRCLLGERRLRGAIEALDDGFALYDRHDRLVICNRRYRELYSPTAELLVPGTPFEVIVKAAIEAGLCSDKRGTPEEWLRNRVAAHREGISDTNQRLNSGRWIKVSDRRTVDGGIVALRVDVTDFKAATEAAKAAKVAKSEFLSVLTHQLRTPLTVILGNARILSGNGQLPQIVALRNALAASNDANLSGRTEAALAFLQGLAQKVEVSGAHLLHLITEALDYSALESGRVAIKFEVLNLRVIVGDIIDSFKARAARKGLVLSGRLDDLQVLADPERLGQILRNLVDNAIKFSDSGKVKVSARQIEGMVEISILDTGCGIAEHHIGHLFEAFRQIDASSTRKMGGTGLGLAIAKRLVDLHGGQMSVRSRPGVGSLFRFSIPAAPR